MDWRGELVRLIMVCMKHSLLSHTRWHRIGLAAGLGALLLPLQALAQEAGKEEAPDGAAHNVLNYAIGASIVSGPDYTGGAGRTTKLRPAWALEYGRFKISGARGSALMGYGLDAVDSGVTATLAQSSHFNLRATLRTDDGRDGEGSPRLVGLPEVRSTLRGKLSVGYAITPRWSLGAGYSQDVLNHGGGAQFDTTLGYTFQWTPATKVSFSTSAGFADGTYMRSYFGVPASAATSSPLPQFTPGAGLYSVGAGVDLMHALNHSWVMFGGLHASQLRGDARRSPLTVDPTGYAVSVGLAYRCCR